MRQLDKIEQSLLDRDRFILIPKVLKDTPIPMVRMQKDLEDGTLINEYYSVQDLATAFGMQYTLEEYVTPDFIMIGWGSRPNETLLIRDFLLANGLTDLRADGTLTGLLIEDIKWELITPMSFGIFSRGELRLIPKSVNAEVVV